MVKGIISTIKNDMIKHTVDGCEIRFSPVENGMVYPMIYRISTIQGGEGFLPSTVGCWTILRTCRLRSSSQQNKHPYSSGECPSLSCVLLIPECISKSQNPQITSWPQISNTSKGPIFTLQKSWLSVGGTWIDQIFLNKSWKDFG